MRPHSAADETVRTDDAGETDGPDDCRVRRATRIARLLKLLATTLAALLGVAEALGAL